MIIKNDMNNQMFNMGGGNALPRDYSISLIRFFSLILIITCHMMQYFDMELAWWFNVGVQIFLCISGYLYARRDIGDVIQFYSRRLQKILIPYYIVFLSYGLLQFFAAKDVFSIKLFLKGLLVNARLYGAGHLWFVSTILLCYLLTPLLELYRKRYVHNTKTLLLFMAISACVTCIYFELFVSYYNAAWILCYVIGYLLGTNKKGGWISEKILLAFFGSLAIIGNGIQIYFSYIASSSFWNYEKFCNYNHVYLGVFIFLLNQNVCARIRLHRLEKFLSITDKYGYEMYLTHQLIILGPFSLMAITPLLSFNIIIIVCLVMVLSWAVHIVASTVGKLISSFLSTGRKKRYEEI